MSQRTYNVMWADAQLELGNLLVEEIPSDPRPPEKDRVVFFQRVAMFYVRCLQIFRQLEEVYDQVVHPQKRRSVRATLDSVMGRLCELKNEMVEKEFSEYHYMDDIIHDLKLQPSVLEIPIPRFFLAECSEEVQQRKTMLTDIFKMVQDTEIPQPQTVKALHPVEAVGIIQMAERARQGRLRAKLNQESRKMNRMFKTKEYGPEDMEAAAVCIQKVWRDFVQRKKARIDLEEEMVFLGMAMNTKLQVQCPAEITAKATEVRTRVKQQEHENDYQTSVVDIKKQLQDLEAHDIGNTMKEQIRQWFIECRDATGTFPEYPPEDEGGSALIFAEKNLEQLVEELAAKEEEEANKPKDKKDKKEDPKKTGKKDKGKAEAEEEEEGLTMLPSAFLTELQLQYKIFEDYWENRIELDNFAQRHEVELIKEEQRKVIEEEIRKAVDEEMNQELAALKVTVDKDKPAKAKGNAKKKKGGKGGKKKKEKDLTANRTLESLCQELVEQGLMKKPNAVNIQDYIGDYGYLGTTLRQYDIEPMPSLSDVRQVLTLFAILPLGSQLVHEKAPLIKAILLAGPAGVGKKMLVHAICHETGATMFDLSPLNIAGKYPGKSSLTMMLHMVFKVARLMQPSVIWIGDAEKMFYKKVPKEEKELDPKRLKKDLPKALKGIKGEDRVLVVGTTRNPQNADIKSMCKMYNKILLIPRPDHGSRYILWKQLLTKQGAELTKALDLSSLAKISDGYTAGHIVQVVQKVITRRRILQQPNRPLTAAEFIPHLAKINPVFQEEEAALKAWYAKTPLGKKRANLAAGKDEEADKKGKDAKKGKGKGKK